MTCVEIPSKFIILLPQVMASKDNRFWLISELRQWCKDNLSGAQIGRRIRTLDDPYGSAFVLAFDEPNDALAFKMHWL